MSARVRCSWTSTPTTFNIAPDAVGAARHAWDEGRHRRGPVRSDGTDRGDPRRRWRRTRSSKTRRRRIGARRRIGDGWVMAGEAATIGTFSFFPSKNLGGYGDGGMIVMQDESLFDAAGEAAHAWQPSHLLPRDGRLQQPSRCAAGRGAQGQAAASGRRGAPVGGRTPRSMTRHSAMWRRSSTPCDRSAQRVDLQPVYHPCAEARCAAGASQGGAASERRCTIRCRCTCSPASSISGTRKASVRNRSGRRPKCSRSPSIRNSPARSSKKLSSAVRSFFGR